MRDIVLTLFVLPAILRLGRIEDVTLDALMARRRQLKGALHAENCRRDTAAIGAVRNPPTMTSEIGCPYPRAIRQRPMGSNTANSSGKNPISRVELMALESPAMNRKLGLKKLQNKSIRMRSPAVLSRLPRLLPKVSPLPGMR